jgi:hypothetical protein
MEIKLFHEFFTGQNPKSLMDHIQRMASGEAPYFPATLSLVYGTLAKKVLLPPIASGSGSEKSGETRDKGVVEPVPTIQTSNSTPNVDPFDNCIVRLICPRCGQTERLVALFGDLLCPKCPRINRKRGRPRMQCPLCNTVRASRRSTSCLARGCKAVFA